MTAVPSLGRARKSALLRPENATTPPAPSGIPRVIFISEHGGNEAAPSPAENLCPIKLAAGLMAAEVEPERGCFREYALADRRDRIDHAAVAAEPVVGQRHDTQVGRRGR
jgi:hypothetical protein